MILAVVGSRDFPNRKLVFQTLSELHTKYEFKEIFSGGARGVDKWADEFADENCVDFSRRPAKWKKYGKAAGMLRNTTIVDEVVDFDWPTKAVIAFWDVKSRGTRDTIKKANEKKLPVLVVYPDGSRHTNDYWYYD